MKQNSVVLYPLENAELLLTRAQDYKDNTYNKNVCFCFVDYSRPISFDCVDFELMWRTLFYCAIPKYLVECLKDLYKNQTADVDIVGESTGPLKVQWCVRQGCPFSPMMFNIIYSELIRDIHCRSGKIGLR